MESPVTTPGLPQEIIDQIIDEVARYSINDEDSYYSYQTLDTLKSCALVSRAFHGRSRSHIFSTVDLVIDSHAQKRAGRLVKVLRQNNLAPVVQHIHRLNFIYDFRNDYLPDFIVRTRTTKPFLKIRNFFGRSVKEIVGLQTNNIYRVLDTINDATLTHLGIGYCAGVAQYMAQKPELDNKLLRIIAKPSLESLHLHNFMDFPEIYVRNAFQSSSLTELKLSYVRFSRGASLPLASHDTPHTLAKLERMQLRFVSYKALLAVVRTLDPALNAHSSPITSVQVPTIYSHVFSHLQTLVVCLPKYVGELNALWDLMQIAAPSLKSLGIECHGQSDIPSLESINLSRFLSLKRLDFSLLLLGEFREPRKEQYITDILSSGTLPMMLETINIIFNIPPGPGAFPPNIRWSSLDDALNNPLFVNLKSVVVDVKVVIYDSGTWSSEHQVKNSQMKETSRFLPIMAASASVDTRIYLHIVDSLRGLLPGYHFHLR